VSGCTASRQNGIALFAGIIFLAGFVVIAVWLLRR